MELALDNDGLLTTAEDSPFNDPVFGFLFRIAWALFGLGGSIASRLGLHGFDWSLFFAGLVAVGTLFIVYVAFRATRMLLGRDVEFEYWKYLRTCEACHVEPSTSSFAFRPQKSFLVIVLSRLRPLAFAFVALLLFLALSKFAVAMAPNTVFGSDPLGSHARYLADFALTLILQIAIRLLVVVLVMWVSYVVFRRIVSALSRTALYATIERRMSKGRAKVVRNR
ncbi:MAG: hypothetical protein Q4A07_00535 [Coriobacteriales bacterium]|nr:hypothetical protein [Coriobacteriales bacterium]